MPTIRATHGASVPTESIDMRTLFRHLKRPPLLPAFIVLLLLAGAAAHVLPSHHLRIAAGPVDGSYYQTARQYQQLLEAHGYRVDIVPIANTDEIGARVADPRARLDLGFVADGHAAAGNSALIPLGDIQLQPIFVFAQRDVATARPDASFADLRGLSLVLPPEHSLTSRTLLRIFALSGIDAGNTRIAFLPLHDAIERLKTHEFDAGLFMLGADSALMADLAKRPDLTLMPLAQREAITKKLPFLKEVHVPAGIYDLQRDVPERDVPLLAATISVVARSDLPPATAYAVLAAMRDAHRAGSYVNGPGEFPRDSGGAGQTNGFVDTFYASGVPWIYAHLPPALASVIDAYLAPLLALWLATSVFKVIGELEKIRRIGVHALAHGALWWLRRRDAASRPLSARARALLQRIETGIENERQDIGDLLAELRAARVLHETALPARG
ncbi:hypothetical protein Bsp3421_002633 [Burkholderia sp. FERM BP-3421]|nr:hypothetical protein Bsp3421_002633 [Burkholderia sp. FERM BP-3421]